MLTADKRPALIAVMALVSLMFPFLAGLDWHAAGAEVVAVPAAAATAGAKVDSERSDQTRAAAVRRSSRAPEGLLRGLHERAQSLRVSATGVSQRADGTRGRRVRRGARARARARGRHRDLARPGALRASLPIRPCARSGDPGHRVARVRARSLLAPVDAGRGIEREREVGRRIRLLRRFPGPSAVPSFVGHGACRSPRGAARGRRDAHVGGRLARALFGAQLRQGERDHDGPDSRTVFFGVVAIAARHDCHLARSARRRAQVQARVGHGDESEQRGDARIQDSRDRICGDDAARRHSRTRVLPLPPARDRGKVGLEQARGVARRGRAIRIGHRLRQPREPRADLRGGGLGVPRSRGDGPLPPAHRRGARRIPGAPDARQAGEHLPFRTRRSSPSSTIRPSAATRRPSSLPKPPSPTTSSYPPSSPRSRSAASGTSASKRPTRPTSCFSRTTSGRCSRTFACSRSTTSSCSGIRS